MRADSAIAARVGGEGETTALAGKANSEEMGRGLGIKSNYVLAATVSVGGGGEAAVGEHKGFCSSSFRGRGSGACESAHQP